MNEKRGRRVDANQAQIVAALRAAGFSVQSIATVGKGCPDLLVGRKWENWLMEVKAPGGTLSPAEVEWHKTWRGQVAIVRGIEDALRVVGVIEKGKETPCSSS